jgi:hypothetical protein
MMKHLWESADGRTTTAQVVIPGSKVKEVLTEMHAGPSGGHFGVSKILDKVKQRYYWLQSRDDVRRWRQQCETCATRRGPRTRTRGLIHQYVGAPFERIAMDIAQPFLQSDRGNRYLLIAMDYFTEFPEV